MVSGARGDRPAIRPRAGQPVGGRHVELGLDGKRVVLTAGAAGIGRATLQTFVEAGARVITCDVDQAALDRLRAELPQVPAIPADVAEPADVDRLFELAEEQLGGLDILINNAGIAGPTGGVEEIAPDDWRRTLEVNLTGQYLCARRAVPLIRAAGGGSIVNLSSAAGRFGFALRTPYAASKWGVIGLTKSLAIELGPDQIRVNAICPGAVEGDRIERVIAAKAQAQGVPVETMRQHYVETASMKRLISPQDVANMILFLCSDAGRLVSGQVIGVDGNVEYLR
jgi:NAD(P)-dependent dehydrogenase (short-subunit alcohol dehydrogenase family)